MQVGASKAIGKKKINDSTAGEIACSFSSLVVVIRARTAISGVYWYGYLFSAIFLIEAEGWLLCSGV